MDIFQAMFLGLLQGITEWLPVSSEGQTVLAGIHLVEITPAEALSYGIFLHLGTLFVVLIRFREIWISFLLGKERLMFEHLILVSIGTTITGVPLLLFIEEIFTAGFAVTLLIGFLLVITGIMLKFVKPGEKDISSLSRYELVILGLIQGLAILPGISRSGVTMTALLMRNINPSSALKFSFLISVPPVTGAVLLSGFPSSLDIYTALVMLISAFIVGTIMMEGLIRFSYRVNFSTFCFFLGGVTILTGLL